MGTLGPSHGICGYLECERQLPLFWLSTVRIIQRSTQLPLAGKAALYGGYSLFLIFLLSLPESKILLDTCEPEGEGGFRTQEEGRRYGSLL